MVEDELLRIALQCHVSRYDWSYMSLFRQDNKKREGEGKDPKGVWRIVADFCRLDVCYRHRQTLIVTVR